MIELLFDLESHIFFFTTDNRELCLRVSKLMHNTPSIDLLPRVRYQIKFKTLCETTRKDLWLRFGLKIYTHDDEKIIIVNTSDIIVRLANDGTCSCHEY